MRSCSPYHEVYYQLQSTTRVVKSTYVSQKLSYVVREMSLKAQTITSESMLTGDLRIELQGLSFHRRQSVQLMVVNNLLTIR